MTHRGCSFNLLSMKSLLLPLALLSLSLGACVSTPKQAVTVEERFAQIDRNGDGRITREEFIDLMITEAFDRADLNNDEFVDAAEARKGGAPASAFMKADSTGTGRITLGEAKMIPSLRARMAIPFDEADVNKNGAISLAEYQAYRAKVREVMR